MLIKNTLIVFALLSLVLLSSTAFGDSGKLAFEQGKTLVGRGDFEGAMEAFATAVRAERSNAEYMQNYSLVRQAIMIRNVLEQEKNPQRWEYYARALHTYYISENLYDQALELDKQIHVRVNSAASAALLAETQLAMDMNAEAAELLSKLPPDKTSVVTEALEGIALARLGKKADALKHADLAGVGDNDGPGVVYCVARLQAATGNVNRATALLTRCFEQIPPSQLDGFKSHAKVAPEFAAMAGTPEFQQVLKTESKVQESNCSGGSSCAGCPMRSQCSKEEAK
jgi:thioredoxin-like negative regulator of GroEL